MTVLVSDEPLHRCPAGVLLVRLLDGAAADSEQAPVSVATSTAMAASFGRIS
jgi:hypothetical protein